VPFDRKPRHSGTAEAQKPSARGPALDMLRFLAAALIVLYHFQDEGPRPLDQLSPVFLRGYLATNFFLILSGYVLGRAYGAKVAAGAVSDGDFLLRRLTRIWPAHLLVLAAFALVVALGHGMGLTVHHADRFNWSDLPAQAALIQAWGLNVGSGWNLPTWSLSALVICYAGFPTLWRRLGGLTGGAALFAGGLAVVGTADLLCHGLRGERLYDLHFDVGVLRALPLFAFGVFIAKAAESEWPNRRWAGTLTLCAATALVGLQLIGRFDFASAGLIGLMIAGAGRMQSRWGASLARKAAEMSFALYITHIFVGMLWFYATRAWIAQTQPPMWAQWLLWALALPMALGAAVLFERLVDRPLQTALNRWLTWANRRKSQQIVTA
jgi:peptidoglycan/LPS O-acetylase OafA/YrhL